jgi:hypothetical protein
MPVDAVRRLGRAAGNRAMARILQRWVDDKGKWYPGAKPADAENWEMFKHSSGQERWRPKTVAVPAAATTTAAVVTAEKPAAAATVAPATTAATKKTDPPDVSDSKTEWWADPKSIRYSQDSISAKFANGTAVDSAARSLRKTPKNVDDYPPLLLRKRKGGKLVSLDNRRLWVFKHAEVPLCKVRWISDDEWKAQSWKMTAGDLGSAFIGVKGPPILDMKDLPTFTPPSSFSRVPAAQYV